MTEKAVVIEESFAGAIAMIAASEELPEQLKRHWTTSLRQFAKATDRPLEVIPARYSAVRNELAGWHHAPSGLTPKTVMNHRSNTKRALLYLSQEKGIPQHGAPLAADWENLRAEIDDKLIRSRLSSFMRYCSANKISPQIVDETVVDKLVEYRNRCSKPANDAFRRLLARAWNANIKNIPEWPKRRLVEPSVKSAVEVEWEEFRGGLRRDVDKYLKGLTQIRKGRTGRHIKPLRESTIKGRRAELQAAARMAVKIGIPFEKLDSLRALLRPNVAEKILDAYWQKNGEKPKLYTIDLARRFVAIAKETKCLNEKDCETLQDIWRRLNEERPPDGPTEKNLDFVRKVLTPGVWGRVVKLPFAMMEEARRQRHRPIRAAVIAQKAVAIAIEAVAPVRLGNLTSIKLGGNLNKPGGPDSNYWLHFAPEDVKNTVRLQFVFKEYLTDLIDEYVRDFWPTLLRGRKEDYLFPGMRRGAKGKVSFSVEISKYIYKATGLKMTVHQFRHAAGAIILKNRPGEFELVRQILGHRSIGTTMRCYVGLETIQASEIFTEMVVAEINEDLLRGEGDHDDRS
jgi:Phage integrase family